MAKDGWDVIERVSGVYALTKTAWRRAIAARQAAPGLVHHCDRDCSKRQPSTLQVLKEHQLIPSMSQPANPYDNASCESLIEDQAATKFCRNVRCRDDEFLGMTRMIDPIVHSYGRGAPRRPLHRPSVSMKSCCMVLFSNK